MSSESLMAVLVGTIGMGGGCCGNGLKRSGVVEVGSCTRGVGICCLIGAIYRIS